MDINYKTIVEYLCNDEETKQNDNFPTKKNIMVSSDNFPEEFSNLFETNSNNKFYRYGVSRYNNDQINISFFTSFLTLIQKQFITLDKKEESVEVINFINQLKEKINEKKFKFELKSKFEKHLVIEKLNNLNLDDGVVLQAIVQILNINLLIFDFEKKNIFSIFNGDFYDPWKTSLLLAKKDKDWEPIFSDKKQFCYNEYFLKKILTTQEILYYNQKYLNKYYSLLDNVNELIELNELNDNSSVEEDSIKEDSENMDTFINPIQEIKNMKLNKTKLKSFKKDKIFEILKRLNCEISKDDKKDEMIITLLSYI
tara:strand:+ start:2305 stop:3240 length:936 start_codon:yes stop_codon:yes gene_type:complete